MFLTLHVYVFDSNDVACNVLTITMRIDSTEKQKFQQVLMLSFFLFMWMFSSFLPSEKTSVLSFTFQPDNSPPKSRVLPDFIFFPRYLHCLVYPASGQKMLLRYIATHSVFVV